MDTFRAWEKERAEEAWNDIGKIAELVEQWKNSESNFQEAYDYLIDIKDLLEEGGWI